MIRFLIKEKIAERGMSVTEFAQEMQIGTTSAYRYLNMQSISLDVLEKIAKTLDCTVKELFLEEGESRDSGIFVWDDRRERVLKKLKVVMDNMSLDASYYAREIDKLLEDSEME